MQRFLSFLFIFTATVLIAQTHGRCGFLEAQEYLFSQDPTARQRVADLMKAAEEPGQAQVQSKTMSGVNYTIPVVFHVLHLGGSENISDAQIKDEITILNRDYTKQNPDTINAVFPFQNLIGNPGIEFRLATLDPNGNCTSGITRHYDVNANWTVNFANYIYTWDRTKYLNIYVVKSMPPGSNAAAYAYYPGSVGPSADGVVVQSIYVGSIGTSNPGNARIITHEVGHWLNLQHLWGSTNQPGVACGDDGVTDTPVTKGYTACNLNNAVDCVSGVVENMQNYMDYAYCQIMFTPGQVTRMLTALNSPIAGRNNIWSANNLLITGVTNPMAGCPPKADFDFNNTVICTGGSGGFTDLSYNAPVTSWEWTSPEASNISTQQNGNLTFVSGGLVSVKLKVSNPYGSDSIVKQKMLVLAPQGSGNPNIVQGFETISFPDNDWLATVPPSGSGFQQTNAAALNGNNCVWVNNYSNKPNAPVTFYTPSFNLQSTVSSQLFFYYAYAQGTANDNDRLKVYGSSDCGATWQTVFNKSGSALNTTGGFVASSFDSPSPEQWIEVIVNTDFYFGGKPNVYFKFEFTADQVNTGNNVYIDDINLSGFASTAVSSQVNSGGTMNISPNPFSQSFMIRGDGLEKITSFSLFDVCGRELKRMDNPVIKQNSLQLNDLDCLSQGIYFVKLNSVGRTQVLKLIKE